MNHSALKFNLISHVIERFATCKLVFQDFYGPLDIIHYRREWAYEGVSCGGVVVGL